MAKMIHTTIPAGINELSSNVIALTINVHSALGPGFLESSYKECLFYEISKAGYLVEKEKPLPLVYKGVKLDIGYRIDILIENTLVVEIKSVECLTDIHSAQVLTYLKLSQNRLGLLMNFNVKLLKDGIKRFVL